MIDPGPARRRPDAGRATASVTPPATDGAFGLPSGRSVAVHTLATGSERARTVVLCHAAPGSGAFDPDPLHTTKRDVTLLALDRPGYGSSQPVDAGAWATVASAADDIAEVLDARGGAPVGVAGWSAGGRVALALAARRPDLVDRVAVIGTPAPNEEVPWVPEEHARALTSLADAPADEVHAVLSEQFADLLPTDVAAPDALELLGAGPADGPALAAPGARARLGTMMAAAFAQGTAGLAQDVAGYMLRPWGFDASDVAAPTLLLYGTRDPLGASRHAQWWQRRLPRARVEMVPDAGHLVIIPIWRRVLAHLAPATLRPSIDLV
jgi:pimeloyl-ACP methyl ester carboxylesterase